MVRIFALIQSALLGLTDSVATRARTSGARAVTMLEWVLIATVAVILFGLLSGRLQDIFGWLIDSIQNAVTSAR